MPRAFLKSNNQTEPSDSVLANFAFLSRSDNRQLGGVAPSIYRNKMGKNIDEILASALCPQELFDDEYEPFLILRSSLLTEKASELCA